MKSSKQGAGSTSHFGDIQEDTALLSACSTEERGKHHVHPRPGRPSSQLFRAMSLHFAQVHDIVGVVSGFVEPDVLLALRQVNQVWKEAIDDQLEQKYDKAMQQAIIIKHNTGVAERYQCMFPSRVLRYGTLCALGGAVLVFPCYVVANETVQVIALALLCSVALAACSAFARWVYESDRRQDWLRNARRWPKDSDQHVCSLGTLAMFSVSLSLVMVAVGLTAIYHISASRLQTHPSNIMVAECMAEKYTGNSPPIEVVFLRPERWHFGKPFVISQSEYTGVDEFYRYIIPNTTVAGMDVDCRKAFADPQRYAQELAANGTVGVPTRNNSFPIWLGFSGNSQDTFWNTWPLQPVNGPIIYQVARNMIFFGGTATKNAYNAWTASPHWAYNRTVLVTRVQYHDLKGTVESFKTALVGTTTLAVTIVVVFCCVLFVQPLYRRYMGRRKMIGGLDEKLLVLKSKPSPVIVHRTALQQQKQKHIL